MEYNPWDKAIDKAYDRGYETGFGDGYVEALNFMAQNIEQRHKYLLILGSTTKESAKEMVYELEKESLKERLSKLDKETLKELIGDLNES